jgi:protein-S-isoprenylcysteine O-methyltransferase Ste14
MSAGGGASLIQAKREDRRVRVALDLFERIFVLALFSRLALLVSRSVLNGANPLNLLILASEGIVVVFVMIRRPAIQVSLRPMDWLLAVGATAGPLLLRPGHTPALVPPAIAAATMLCGIALQIVCKLTLRRSFGVVAANRGLVEKGPYRYVRHPIYASYLVQQAGFLMLNPTPWNASVMAVSLVLQLFRIAAEERILSEDPAHAAFCAAVPYRLLPGIY